MVQQWKGPVVSIFKKVSLWFLLLCSILILFNDEKRREKKTEWNSAAIANFLDLSSSKMRLWNDIYEWVWLLCEFNVRQYFQYFPVVSLAPTFFSHKNYLLTQLKLCNLFKLTPVQFQTNSKWNEYTLFRRVVCQLDATFRIESVERRFFFCCNCSNKHTKTWQQMFLSFDEEIFLLHLS